MLRIRGFTPKWVGWIHHLLVTASSIIVINGEITYFFNHKRWLRQGDLFSPTLFIIAVDVLQQMIVATNETLNGPISNKLNKSIVALQYADDTAIIAKVDLTTLISLKIVLRLFTKISGL